MNQVNMFNFIDSDSVDRYLYIIKDDTEVQMDYMENFNSTKYDELYAITYVFSPTFFSKVDKGFKTVKIVLMIPACLKTLHKWVSKVCCYKREG